LISPATAPPQTTASIAVETSMLRMNPSLIFRSYRPA
jgi:hypothetical protein